jgi:hypothetical protein
MRLTPLRREVMAVEQAIVGRCADVAPCCSRRSEKFHDTGIEDAGTRAVHAANLAGASDSPIPFRANPIRTDRARHGRLACATGGLQGGSCCSR